LELLPRNPVDASPKPRLRENLQMPPSGERGREMERGREKPMRKVRQNLAAAEAKAKSAKRVMTDEEKRLKSKKDTAWHKARRAARNQGCSVEDARVAAAAVSWQD